MDLSIVVPCYNEEGNVELFYEEGKKLNMKLFLSMMVVVTIL